MRSVKRNVIRGIIAPFTVYRVPPLGLPYECESYLYFTLLLSFESIRIIMITKHIIITIVTVLFLLSSPDRV